ncbi:aldose epimerase [Stenotrophomonas oahuensis]|uniref:Aldose epimerase n=1 Tax=Stenotrophomonas oahuensis TaxID=3003271 RepID=A0ABY9YMQ1_9GAMM|nr:aldose epimerase [Stenotrophomonas sp. A5586]WNH52182.1 aldose epimerase [Stenotrophomonas sp. A5586]
MERKPVSPVDDAQAPMPAGPLHWLRCGALEVALAPEAGGRIAQLRYQGVDWLVGPEDGWPATIAWGCYPMVPWAGRIRRGRFDFGGRSFVLPINFEAHAIHGVGFSRPWRIDPLEADVATLSLALPEDEYWPFGGIATQVIELMPDSVRLQLEVRAGAHAMPAVLGWHPWFRKPERMEFAPDAMYPRDEEGIAVYPTVVPTPGSWDDCFISRRDVVLERDGQRLRLRSDSNHWVVYDGAAHATCVEPQTGPPDGFTLMPNRLEPGQCLYLTFEMTFAPCVASTQADPAQP